MRLYIAEKPSLARAIADVLPSPTHKGNGFIRAANGDCVTWCIGHLLEQVEPKKYDPKFQKWQLQHLPIVPDHWQLEPKAKTRQQLAVLGKLTKEFDQIVHAGDPDREGQLLVDQVLDYLKVPPKKKAQVQRCLINDLNPNAVKAALNSLRSNHEFISLSTSALARQRADWLFGINMTRTYTLLGQKVGFDGLLSVGRVQTPLLGMVVRRDKNISSFQSKPFYEVLAHLKQQETPTQSGFTAKWVPSEACEPYMDQDNRVLSKALAQNVVDRITQQPAVVTSAKSRAKSIAPPLPFSLSSLQIDAAKKYGFNAQAVLTACQQLYEKYKLITYPRSDCRYLPTEHFSAASKVLSAIETNSAIDSGQLSHADSTRKSKAWNNQKVDAHHAIIPTIRKLNSQQLTDVEQKIYQLIARQYAAQFCKNYSYNETVVLIKIGSGNFQTKENVDTELGWKHMLAYANRNKTTKPLLPSLKKGDALWCEKGELLSKNTQPPLHFTDATLLAAMTGINRFVSDPAIRKILRETDGLGTEATRAGIIELLFKRGYLLRKAKFIVASDAGKALIHSLPESISKPDMTAMWEASLQNICDRTSNYTAFMEPLIKELKLLIESSKSSQPVEFEGIKSTQKAKPYKRSRKLQGKHPKKSSSKRAGQRSSKAMPRKKAC